MTQILLNHIYIELIYSPRFSVWFAINVFLPLEIFF